METKRLIIAHCDFKPRRRGFGLPGGLQVVFQVGIVGGEAAELPVVVAQAVSHAMALVVALCGLGA